MTLYKFGWQRLLIHQVPQKGGKSYAVAPSAPPPRDWSPEWNRVTAASTSALEKLNGISRDFSSGGGATEFAARQSRINETIAATTAQIDQALALNSTIPASWFGTNLADRNNAIASLEQTKSNLNRYIGTWQPTKVDLISDEIDRQTLLLAAKNRILKGPIEPLPTNGLYPNGSWQYAMWAKGYSLQEISWAEEEISRDPVIQSSTSDFNYYTKLIEDKIQDAIVNGSIPPATQREIVQVPQKTVLPVLGILLTPSGSAPVVRTPTGAIGGVGTNVNGAVQGYDDPVYGEDGQTYVNIGAVPAGIRWSRSPWIVTAAGNPTPNGNAESGIGSFVEGNSTAQYIDTVYGEDGRTYQNPGAVPRGIRWSRRPWNVASTSQEIRISAPPRGVVPGTRSFQVWRRRQVRNAVFGTPGRLATDYGDSTGWNVQSSLEVPRISMSPGEINSRPWCGTGIVTNNPWEAVLIGDGCPVSHLDTIRKFFASARLAPGADQVQIARDICGKLTNQDALIPNVATVSPVDVSQQSPVSFALDSANTAVTNIPGVLRQTVSPRTIAAQNLAARRQSSRVRRSAFR